MTTLGIDCRFAETATGLGRYTRELTSALLRRRDPWEYVLFVRSSKDVSWIPADAAASYRLVEAPFAHYSLFEQTRFPSLLKKSGIRLLFTPHFNVPFLCSVPFVATIHDLILHHFPNKRSMLRRIAYRILMYRTIRKARAIIAVSAFTAGEVRSAYGKKILQKTSVIHEAVSPLFRRAAEDECQRVRRAHFLERPFFLYVGNAKTHKNVQMLIDAFVAANVPDHELILVTSGEEVKRLRLAPSVRVIDHVDDSELPALYSAARCVVSASLYEGFGLPVLEAAACGTPVAVTDGSSFAEIAPHGTELVVPSIEAFVDVFRSPPTEVPARPERTWDQVAADTAAILAQTMG